MAEATTMEEQQLVVFRLGDESYGIEIASVEEIIRLQPVTLVPRTPVFVEGVINLRGRVIPVIDLRRRLGLPAVDATPNSRIIVVEAGAVVVGLVVDAVSEVLRLNMAQIDPPPPVFKKVDVAYLRGVGKVGERLVILLDVEKVLYEQERVALSTTDWQDMAEVVN